MPEESFLDRFCPVEAWLRRITGQECEPLFRTSVVMSPGLSMAAPGHDSHEGAGHSEAEIQPQKCGLISHLTVFCFFLSLFSTQGRLQSAGL